MNHAIAQTATFNLTPILQTAFDSTIADSVDKGQQENPSCLIMVCTVCYFEIDYVQIER
jgi:hypothetical protein